MCGESFNWDVDDDLPQLYKAVNVFDYCMNIYIYNNMPTFYSSTYPWSWWSQGGGGQAPSLELIQKKYKHSYYIEENTREY